MIAEELFDAHFAQVGAAEVRLAAEDAGVGQAELTLSLHALQVDHHQESIWEIIMCHFIITSGFYRD